jgi:hypothetical protein
MLRARCRLAFNTYVSFVRVGNSTRAMPRPPVPSDASLSDITPGSLEGTPARREGTNRTMTSRGASEQRPPWRGTGAQSVQLYVADVSAAPRRGAAQQAGTPRTAARKTSSARTAMADATDASMATTSSAAAATTRGRSLVQGPPHVAMVNSSRDSASRRSTTSQRMNDRSHSGESRASSQIRWPPQYPQPPLALHHYSRYESPLVQTPSRPSSRDRTALGDPPTTRRRGHHSDRSSTRSHSGGSAKPSRRSGSASSQGSHGSRRSTQNSNVQAVLTHIATERALVKRFTDRLKIDAAACLDACLEQLPADTMLHQLLQDRQTKYYASHRIAEVVELALSAAESRQLHAGLVELAARDEAVAELTAAVSRLEEQVEQRERERDDALETVGDLQRRLQPSGRTTHDTGRYQHRTSGGRAGSAFVDFAAELGLHSASEVAAPASSPAAAVKELQATVDGLRAELDASKALHRESRRRARELERVLVEQVEACEAAKMVAAELQQQLDESKSQIRALEQVVSSNRGDDDLLHAEAARVTLAGQTAELVGWQRAARNLADNGVHLWNALDETASVLVGTLRTADATATATDAAITVVEGCEVALVRLLELAGHHAAGLRQQCAELQRKHADDAQHDAAASSSQSLRTWQLNVLETATTSAAATASLLRDRSELKQVTERVRQMVTATRASPSSAERLSDTQTPSPAADRAARDNSSLVISVPDTNELALAVAAHITPSLLSQLQGEYESQQAYAVQQSHDGTSSVSDALRAHATVVERSVAALEEPAHRSVNSCRRLERYDRPRPP